MQIRTARLKPGLLFPALAVLVLTTGPAHAQSRDTKTEMIVNGAGTALEIVNTPSECGNSQKGCKEARLKETMNLKMRLEGDRDCRRTGGYRWQLEAVYLGGFNSEVKPDKPGNLPAIVAEDFDIDLETGRINPQSQSHKKIDFRNSNNNAYNVWYQVTAVCKSRMGRLVGEPISTDPLIRNRGRR